MTRLVLAHGHVLDPAGTRFLMGSHLIVDCGDITYVGSGDPPDPIPGETRIELAGAYVLPGLIDSHFHLISRSAAIVDEDLIAVGMIEGVVNAAERLAAGVTSVRDCGCRHDGIHTLDRSIESGLVRGPRTYAAGTNPTGPRAPGHWRNVVARDADDLRSVIRTQVKNGAQWIKLILSHAGNPTDWSSVTRYLTDEEITAGVDEAHRLGVKIGCHCEGWDVAATAVRSGMDSLDHAPLLDVRTAAEMAERGTVYVPTVWAFSVDAGVDLHLMPDPDREDLLRWQAEHRASVRRAHAAGVTIAAGSDAEGSLPERGVLVSEMQALAGCGLSPTEVLIAATRAGAGLIGHGDDLGVIKSGALADLVVVAANPLEDLDTLLEPLLVIARGQIVRDNRTPSVVADQLPASARRTVAATARWTP